MTLPVTSLDPFSFFETVILKYLRFSSRPRRTAEATIRRPTRTVVQLDEAQ
jgi:hypothetical protein